MLKALTFSFNDYAKSSPAIPAIVTNIDKSLVNIIKDEIDIEQKKYILENFYYGYVHLTVDEFCDFLCYLQYHYSKNPYIFQNKNISIVVKFILNSFRKHNPYCDFYSLRRYFLYETQQYFSPDHPPVCVWKYEGNSKAIKNVDENLLSLILISIDLLNLIEDLKKNFFLT